VKEKEIASMSNWVRKDFFSDFAFIFTFCLLAAVSYAQEDEIIAGGKGKYTKYCANCHGTAAKGDGPLAQMLLVKPADLTQLSKRHEGQFPFWRVYRMIDGREEARGHGSREMPLWGFIFQAEEGATQAPYQEDLVRGRIWQLVYFLESIQEK
jgi:mono/diheme cytochrome c family protein